MKFPAAKFTTANLTWHEILSGSGAGCEICGARDVWGAPYVGSAMGGTWDLGYVGRGVWDVGCCCEFAFVRHEPVLVFARADRRGPPRATSGGPWTHSVAGFFSFTVVIAFRCFLRPPHLRRCGAFACSHRSPLRLPKPWRALASGCALALAASGRLFSIRTVRGKMCESCSGGKGVETHGKLQENGDLLGEDAGLDQRSVCGGGEGGGTAPGMQMG